MAPGLTQKRAAGYLAVLFPLFGLALVRLWAVIGGHVPGAVTAALAFLCTLLGLLLCWRLGVDQALLHPFKNGLTNFLVGGISFLIGGVLDTSFAMFDPSGLTIDAWIFHGLSALGSGVVFACLVLCALTAIREQQWRCMGARRQLLILLVVINALAVFYLCRSATVYVWDNAGYWTVARSLSAAPLGMTQLTGVLESVITQEYNHLLAFPISLVMRIFGDSRMVFILTAVNLYLLPCLWGLCALARDRRYGGVLLALLFPMLTYLTLLGYVDVAAAAPAIWAFVLWNRGEGTPLARGILCGFLLGSAFLLRRYFFFFAPSFGLMALLAGPLKKKDHWVAFCGLLGGCGVWSLFFSQSFLVDKLTVQYGDLYSAYVLGLKSDVLLFCRYFGFLVLGWAVLRGVWRLVRVPPLRRETAMALGQLALCFFLLTRVQSHGQQHLLLYLPALAVLLAPKASDGLAPRCTAWTLAGCVTLVTLLPTPQPSTISQIPFPTPVASFTFHPPVRGDINALVALMDYVDSLSLQGEKSAAVVASSLSFNGETLSNLRPSLNRPSPAITTRLVYMSAVDKRDGFSWNILDADYLIVGNPVQTHLGEENQQVVALVAHALLEGKGLGTAYALLPETFDLAGGVTVQIYQRLRPITQTERQSISTALTLRYPDYAALYALPSGE